MNILNRIYRIVKTSIATQFENWNPKEQASDEPKIEDPLFENTREKVRSEETTLSSIDPVLAEYYANLEIPYGSDLQTVRAAWKKLLKKYHPDVYSGIPEKEQMATEIVKRLNHAYRELEKRLSDEHQT